jgi:hypothetical protein
MASGEDKEIGIWVKTVQSEMKYVRLKLSDTVQVLRDKVVLYPDHGTHLLFGGRELFLVLFLLFYF